MSFEMGVRMTGLPDFGQQMIQFRDELPGLVETIEYKSAEMVADEARPTVPVDSGRSAQSVQAYMTGSIAMTQGGEGLDYYSWLEFGGASGRNLSNERAVVPEGRYIYPAYERLQPQVQSLMETELSKLASTIFRG